MTETTEITAEDLIRKARIKFLYDSPFFASISMYLNLKESEDIETMGIDFRGNLYYNPKWVLQLDFEQVKYAIAHETLHLAFEHLLRLGNREKFLWNVATDFAVNLIIEEENERVYMQSHEERFKRPMGILISDKFKGMSAEQIYDKIYKEMQKYKGFKTLDVHIFPEINGIDKHGKGIEKGIKKGFGDVNITERELKGEQQKWKKRLVEATTWAKQMGKLPMGIERLVNGLLDSKINWKGLLYRYITHEIPYDLSYARPHKKSISVDVYMPYVVKECVEIVVAIDTSGSISDKELKDFLSEIKGISQSFANIRMTIIVCDCKVKGVYELNNSSDLSQIQIKGYGGTDFRPVYDWLEKNKPTAKLLIYFTDGYGEYPNNEIVKTLWVLPRDYDVPFGEKIVFGGE